MEKSLEKVQRFFIEKKVAILCSPHSAAFVIAFFLSGSTDVSPGMETEV